MTALACSLALLTQACSVIGVRPVEHGGGQVAGGGPPDCTRSRAAPIVDTVGASLLAAVAVISLVGASQSGRDPCDSGDSVDDDWCFDLDFTDALLTSAAVAGLGALAYAGSAYYGYSHVEACREAGRSMQAPRPRVGDAPPVDAPVE